MIELAATFIVIWFVFKLSCVALVVVVGLIRVANAMRGEKS